MGRAKELLPDKAYKAKQRLKKLSLDLVEQSFVEGNLVQPTCRVSKRSGRDMLALTCSLRRAHRSALRGVIGRSTLQRYFVQAKRQKKQ
eukprot:1805167-Prorocentrum_lima.AAC.1